MQYVFLDIYMCYISLGCGINEKELTMFVEHYYCSWRPLGGDIM